jgi:DNA-binding CsgD family transcriptional regulator
MDERHTRTLGTAVAIVSLALGILGTTDFLTDLALGVSKVHLVVEGTTLVVGFGGFVWLLVRLREAFREARAIRADAAALTLSLAAARQEADRWKVEARDLLKGLSEAIDHQLHRWGLTASEKEVALLLLKGLSFKDIAGLRGTNENTVRQQARALYKKAGLTGRHELAAFFLEDLLVAPGGAPAAATATDAG